MARQFPPPPPPKDGPPKPSISITSPADGAAFNGGTLVPDAITVTGRAGSGGPMGVTVQLGDSPAQQATLTLDSPPPDDTIDSGSWSFTGTPPPSAVGAMTITATVHTIRGRRRTASDTVTVKIRNPFAEGKTIWYLVANGHLDRNPLILESPDANGRFTGTMSTSGGLDSGLPLLDGALWQEDARRLSFSVKLENNEVLTFTGFLFDLAPDGLRIQGDWGQGSGAPDPLVPQYGLAGTFTGDRFEDPRRPGFGWFALGFDASVVATPIGATWTGHLWTWNTLGHPEQGDFSMPVVFTPEAGQWKMSVSAFSVDIGERYALQPGQIGSGAVNGDHATLNLPLHGSGFMDFDLPLDLSTDATIYPPDVGAQPGVPHSGNKLDMVGQGQVGGDTFWAAFRGTIDAWP
jgi:hypothetical protein